MELSYFFNYFIPAGWSLVNSKKQVIKFSEENPLAPSNTLPSANVQDFCDTFGTGIALNENGVEPPGYGNMVGIAPSIWDIVVHNAQPVKNFLNFMGVVASNTLSELGAQLKSVFTGVSRQAGEFLKDAINKANQPSITADPDDALVTVEYPPEFKATVKELSKLLASSDISVKANYTDIGAGGSEITWDGYEETNFRSAVTNLYRRAGVLASDSLAWLSTFASPIQGKLTAGVLKNKINGYVIPYFIELGPESGHDWHDIPDLSNLELQMNTSVESVVVFSLGVTFSAQFRGVEMWGFHSWYQLSGNLDINDGVLPPYQTTDYEYDGNIYTFPLFTNMGTGFGGYSGRVNIWNPQVRVTDKFFDGLSASERVDSSNFEWITFALNGRSSIEEVEREYYAEVNSTIGDVLSAGNYDVLGANNSADAQTRQNEALLTAVTTATIGALSGISDLVVSLPATANVHPIDLEEEETIADVPLTIPQAQTQANEALATLGGSEGIPYNPLISATGDYGMFTLYKVTLAQLKALSSKLWNPTTQLFAGFHTDPSQAIISLMAYPMDIDSASSNSDIVCGNTNCSPAQGKIISKLFHDKDLGTIQIPNYFNNFMDYSPYTKVSLYLPFIGIVQLDPDEVMGATIRLKYRVEVITGTCIASVEVTKGSMSAVLYQFTGSMGMSLPMSAGDFSRTYATLLSAIGTVAGGLTGNIPLTVASGSKFASDLLGGKPSVVKAGGMSGNSSMCGNMSPYVIIDRPVPDKPTNYEALRGVPTNRYISVSSLSGFVQLLDYRLEINEITDTEKVELDGILKQGFLI